MLTCDDLLKFCSDRRENLTAPWSAGDHTYATNGHVIVRVPRLPDVPENALAPKVAANEDHAMFPYAEPATWFPLSDIELPDAPKCHDCDGKGTHPDCPECDGDGAITFSSSQHDYEVTCKSCDGDPKPHSCDNCGGTGKDERRFVRVSVGGACFQRHYLAMLKALPNCKIGPDVDPLKQAPFVFDGGDGLLMPCRP